MTLLTACSLFKTREKIIYVNNYCTLDTVIDASVKDKAALKASKVSKEFILQIKNHNDLWRTTCKAEANDAIATIISQPEVQTDVSTAPTN